MPVSSNVSHHIFKSVQLVVLRKLPASGKVGSLREEFMEQSSRLSFPFSKMGPTETKVNCWLVLRAGVFRRAASSGMHRAEAPCNGQRRSSILAPKAYRINLMVYCIAPESVFSSPRSVGALQAQPQEGRMRSSSLARQIV